MTFIDIHHGIVYQYYIFSNELSINSVFYFHQFVCVKGYKRKFKCIIGIFGYRFLIIRNNLSALMFTATIEVNIYIISNDAWLLSS